MSPMPFLPHVLRILKMLVQPAPLITIIVMSMALAIATKVGVFGWPLIGVLLSWLFRYSFCFLDELVSGAAEAPVLSIEMLMTSIGEWRSVLPLVLAVLAFVLSGAGSFWFGWLAGGIVGVFLLVTLPAVLGVQGWTGSVRQSLNASICVTFAKILGEGYAWIVGVTGIAVIIGAIAVSIPTPVFVRFIGLIYAWLTIIAMTGGMIYARRAEIEAHTDFLEMIRPVVDHAELVRVREHAIDTIYGSWRSGASDNAWRTLCQHLRNCADPTAELRIVYSRVSGWQPPGMAQRVAQELMERLLAENREGEALSVARDSLQVSAQFRPRTDSELIRLVRISTRTNDWETARMLLRVFSTCSADDPLRAEATRLAEMVDQRIRQI